MKRIGLAVFGLLVLSAGAVQAQLTDAQIIQRAVMAAPARARAGAAVVKWNPDFSYTTIKEGQGQWVCYDHSGGPGEQAFNVQCTNPGNLERVAQNYKLEAQAGGDRDRANELVAEAESNGTRVQPVYGSLRSKPERGSMDRRVAGNTYCQDQLRSACLYFLSRA